MPPGTQCLGSQRSGHSRWGISGVPSVTSSCQWPASVQCGWQPGDGGLDEVPLHQGLGMAWHGSWAWPQSNLQFSPVEPEAQALGWERCCPGH